MADVLMPALVLIVAVGLCCAAGLLLYGRAAAASEADRKHQRLAAPAPFQRVLLLGPADSGKSTLLWQAVKFFEEGPPSERSTSAEMARPKRSTGGLVRWVLRVPSASGALATVQVCDGGGAPDVRRQWVALVKDADVRALVFVAEVDDDSDETLSLFRQLGNAPWARSARLLVALTKADLLDSPAAVERLRQERLADYRAACPRPFALDVLDTHDEQAARRLLLEACADAEPD